MTGIISSAASDFKTALSRENGELDYTAPEGTLYLSFTQDFQPECLWHFCKLPSPDKIIKFFQQRLNVERADIHITINSDIKIPGFRIAIHGRDDDHDIFSAGTFLPHGIFKELLAMTSRHGRGDGTRILAAHHDFFKPLGLHRIELKASNMGSAFWPIFGFLPDEDRWSIMAIDMCKILDTWPEKNIDNETIQALRDCIEMDNPESLYELVNCPAKIGEKKAIYRLFYDLRESPNGHKYKAYLDLKNEKSCALLNARIAPYQATGPESPTTSLSSSACGIDSSPSS